MEQIFLMTIAISLLLIFLLISKIKTKPANIFLASLLLIVVLNEIVNIIIIRRAFGGFYYFLNIVNATPVLIGLLSYFYVKTITKQTKSFKLLNLLHLIPFIIALFVSFYSYSINNNNVFLNAFLDIFLNNIVSLVYIIAALINLRKYKKNILNNFSYIENIDNKWLILFIKIEFVVWLIYLFMISAIYLGILVHDEANLYINLSITVFIFLISFHGLRNSSVFSSIDFDSNIITPEVKSEFLEIRDNTNTSEFENMVFIKKETISESDTQALENNFKELKEYLEVKKPFLQEKITIQELSNQSNISVKLISEIIKTKFKTTYFDLINSYRIEYFKKEILAPENESFSILGVAYNCGFSSKSAFNRAHKKHTNTTPSEFVKLHKK